MVVHKRVAGSAVLQRRIELLLNGVGEGSTVCGGCLPVCLRRTTTTTATASRHATDRLAS